MHTCNGSSSVSTVNSFVKTAVKICACTEDWDVTLACVAQVAYVSCSGVDDQCVDNDARKHLEGYLVESCGRKKSREAS